MVMLKLKQETWEITFTYSEDASINNAVLGLTFPQNSDYTPNQIATLALDGVQSGKLLAGEEFAMFEIDKITGATARKVER